MGSRPLTGRRVVVTRATDQASRLSERVGELGAEVVAVPTIEVVAAADGGVALVDALGRLREFAWLVVTSANGARRVAERLDPADLAQTGVRLAAIGPGTADALGAAGFVPDLVPDRFVAEGLLEVFPAPPPDGGAVLLAQAAGARAVLGDTLTERGWRVERVEAYRTVHPELGLDQIERAAAADAITFTSASTVTGFVTAAGVAAAPPVVVCIGPVTADAATAAGLRVDAVADPHTVDGLVDALVDVLGSRGA